MQTAIPYDCQSAYERLVREAVINMSVTCQGWKVPGRSDFRRQRSSILTSADDVIIMHVNTSNIISLSLA
jgi:hypothetical protein